MGRIIGIDYGLARIGLAVSDAMGIIASPHGTVQTASRSEETLRRLVEAIDACAAEKGDSIDAIVVGMPLMMDGSVGLKGDEVKDFVEKLKLRTEIPIHVWDERLTTVQAERGMREAGMSRKKRKGVVDKTAAAILLQSYLDAQP